ncbi:hypothetical protein [Mesorhizobium sp.]|nr:hypothetical protein [Mesorhizobium sp.]
MTSTCIGAFLLAALVLLKDVNWRPRTGALPERDTIFGSNQRALSRSAA